jgi:hypothetical protein
LLLPVVKLLVPADWPINVLEDPVVIWLPAIPPTAVLPVPVDNCNAKWPTATIGLLEAEPAAPPIATLAVAPALNESYQ